MINTLTGNIDYNDSGQGYITLMVNGVGYLVFLVARTDLRFIAGERTPPQRKFYIHENIVAASQGPSKYDLYGFETEQERELFRAIIKNCDRVGPSAAMKVMNIAPPEQLLQAIRLGNTKYIERGVGEKTAQQVILGMQRWAASGMQRWAASEAGLR